MEVAIVMPMYNASSSVVRAINSVINQTHIRWKLYVIDDCSTDDSYDIVNKNFRDERIILLMNESNQGVSSTRNRGIEHSKEDIVCFIDSDDEWLENKLYLQIEEVKKGAGLVFSSYYYQKNKTHTINNKGFFLSHEDFLKKKFRVCFSSVCVNFNGREKEMFKKIGHEDFEYLNRLFLLNNKAVVISTPMVKYHCQVNSLSSNKIAAAKWHYAILKNNFNFSLPVRLYYFAHYLFQGLFFSFKYK